MNEEFSFKELYDVVIKTTYPIEIEGKVLEKDETVAVFDKIQLANFNEQKKFVTANGGYDNRARVWWEETNEVQLSFVQGIFSKTQLALMNNLRLTKEVDNSIMLNKREILESNENGIIEISVPIYTPLFIYDKDGNKLTGFEIIDNQHIDIKSAYKEVIIDYWYNHKGYTLLQIGQSLNNGTFYLIGKTKTKDDITGQTRTGIIQIPKLKLMSEFSIRLGKNAIPVVGQLSAVAIPVGDKGTKRIMEIAFLDDDIDNI